MPGLFCLYLFSAMTPGAASLMFDPNVEAPMSTCPSVSNRSPLSNSVPAPSETDCVPVSANVAVPPALGKAGSLVQLPPTVHDPPAGPIHVPSTCARATPPTIADTAATIMPVVRRPRIATPLVVVTRSGSGGNVSRVVRREGVVAARRPSASAVPLVEGPIEEQLPLLEERS